MPPSFPGFGIVNSPKSEGSTYDPTNLNTGRLFAAPDGSVLAELFQLDMAGPQPTLLEVYILDLGDSYVYADNTQKHVHRVVEEHGKISFVLSLDANADLSLPAGTYTIEARADLADGTQVKSKKSLNVLDSAVLSSAVTTSNEITTVYKTGAKGERGAPGVGLIAGGDPGQWLRKASSTDYDAKWVDLDVTNATGVLPLAHGGTGATTQAGARSALGLGTAATSDINDFATAAQGAKADTAVQPADLTAPGLVIDGGLL